MVIVQKLRKLKKKIVESKSFLTARGKLVDYTEWHAFGLGLIDGVGFHNKGYRLEYWMKQLDDVKEEPHYYEVGYFAARLLKYLTAAGLILHIYGVDGLTRLVPGLGQ